MKEKANYGRSVASFMAAGITHKPTAVRRAMANIPPKQKRSMRDTVTRCYDELATIEMQLREERNNATSVRCRGVQPALFPLARRLSSRTCANAANEAMSSPRCGCAAKCCFMSSATIRNPRCPPSSRAIPCNTLGRPYSTISRLGTPGASASACATTCATAGARTAKELASRTGCAAQTQTRTQGRALGAERRARS